MNTRTPVPAWMLAALPAILLAVSGCQEFAVAGGGYTRVYGDYGYVGPWEGGRVDLEGVYLAPPPYQQFDRGRPEENRRRAEAPERGRGPEHGASVQHPAPVPRPGPVEHRVPEQRPAPVQHPAPAPRAAPVGPRAPEQRAAPVERPAPRPIPSIPNNPRPAPERGNGHTARR
jgi:hypothetical protein